MAKTPSIKSQVIQRQTGLFEQLRARVFGNQTLSSYERRSAFWFQTLFQNELNKQGIRFTGKSVEYISGQFQAKRIISVRSVDPGQFYFFSYYPEHHNTLPFYDRFPCVLVLDRTSTGFLGLNFHYLPYTDRARLFDALYTHRKPDVNPIDTEIDVSYDMLSSSSKYFGYAACVRRYLYNSCRSNLLQIGETEWDLALFLPVALFQKQPQSAVWKWSEKRNNQQRRR